MKKHRLKMKKKTFKLQKITSFLGIKYWRTIFQSDNLDAISKAIEFINTETDEILF